MKKILIIITSLMLATGLTSCNNPVSQKVENNEIKKEITNTAKVEQKEEIKKDIVITKKDKNIFFEDKKITSDGDIDLENYNSSNNVDKAGEKFVAYDVIGNYRTFAIYEKTSGILNSGMGIFQLFMFNGKESKEINSYISSILGIKDTGFETFLINKPEYIKTQIKDDSTGVYMDFEIQNWIKEFPQFRSEGEMDIPELYLDETKKLGEEFNIIKKANKENRENGILRFYFNNI